MKRAMVVLLLLAFGTRAEEKESFAALETEFQAEWAKTRSDDDRTRLMKRTGPKLVSYAKRFPKEADALPALKRAFELAAEAEDGKTAARGVAVIRKEFAKSKGLIGLAGVIGASGKEGRGWLREQRDKAEGDAKKEATLALIAALEGGMLAADADETKELMKELADLRKAAVEEYKMRDVFVGASLPDLKAEGLDGKETRLSQHKGKVVVLDAWATWCGPCKAMIPHERDLADRMAGKPFALVSISFDAKKETLTKFLETEKMPWVHWWNVPSNDLRAALGVKSFPTILVLDGKGVIRFKGVRGKAMDRAVDKLLSEKD